MAVWQEMIKIYDDNTMARMSYMNIVDNILGNIYCETEIERGKEETKIMSLYDIALASCLQPRNIVPAETDTSSVVVLSS